jgi:hypothetical protein
MFSDGQVVHGSSTAYRAAAAAGVCKLGDAVALPEPLTDFWSAWRSLNGTRRDTPWGEVVTDRRYPLVWESNHVAVLRNHQDVTAEEIRSELLPALRAARAAFEHVEFWDLADTSPALEALKPGADHSGTDLVMVHEGDPDALPQTTLPGMEVVELAEPGEDFWEVYRSSRDDFGDHLAGEVVDQLVLRDREVLIPAGLRTFVAWADGQVAGFASLISLAGVGYVDNVVTIPGYRRRGVATVTTALAIRASLASGDLAVHLLTEAGSDAQRIYERLGMRGLVRVTSVTRRLPPDEGSIGIMAR